MRMYAWHNSTDFQPSISALDAALLAKCMAIGYTSGLSELRNAIAQTIWGIMLMSAVEISREMDSGDGPTVNKNGHREKVSSGVCNLGSSNEMKGCKNKWMTPPPVMPRTPTYSHVRLFGYRSWSSKDQSHLYE